MVVTVAGGIAVAGNGGQSTVDENGYSCHEDG